MEALVIEQTKYSPRVELNPAGLIQIQGRSILEDPFAFYKPILTWVINVTAGSLKVDIKLEYMNTSSSIQIYKILTLIQDNFSIGEARVNWYYDEDDEDTFELGKEFEAQLKLPFGFIKLTDAA